MKISIIGTGYVGIVQGVCFADTGNDVLCMDIDQGKIEQLKKGKAPIYEPGLEEMLKRNIEEGRLAFTTSLEEAVKDRKVIFLCLPTPPAEDGSADLSRILDVAERISGMITNGQVVVSKSTVPVGTADRIKALFVAKGKKGAPVVSNPEFLKEGAAIQDSIKPDRIVIGTRDKKAIEVLSELYSPFVRTGNPIHIMDERSSEMTKYAANALLATKISFMNELALLCDEFGADVDLVRKGVGADPRIGTQFLFSGIGYGGSCFPKDVKALTKMAHQKNMTFEILEAVDKVNDRQKRVLLTKLLRFFDGDIAGKTIALWGLAFKPNTDDIREAPSLILIEDLLKGKARIHAYDPVAMENVKALYGDSVSYFKNNYEAIKGADALLLLTEWNEFRRPDFEKMKSMMKRPAVFDGRNIYDPHEMKEKGFEYFGIGRGRRTGRTE